MAGEIHFKGGWLAIGQEAAVAAGRSPELNFELRIQKLAEGRANRAGHAEFEPGELVQLLEIVDRRSGELRRPNSSTVHRAIKKLVGAGLLLPDSGTRCLVLPPWVAQKRVGRGGCDFHRTRAQAEEQRRRRPRAAEPPAVAPDATP